MNSQKIEPGKILLAKNIKPTPIRLKVLETLLSQTHAMRLYDIEIFGWSGKDVDLQGY